MTPSPLPARCALAVAAPLCIAALVTACGPAKSSANPGAAVTVTVTPTAPASSAPATVAPTSPAPATSPAAPAGPQPCPTRYLAARLGQGQGAAGSTYIPIVFTNISNVACTLYGYPGVAFAGGSPVSVIGRPATEDPATPRQLVTLDPGAAAYAQLRIVDAENYPAARCRLVTATYLQVIPPNQTTPVYIADSSPTCSNPIDILTIQVVKPGSGS